MSLKFTAVFAASLVAAACLSVDEARAIKTATASVACPTAKLQAAIDAAAPGVPTTISVSGICQETIEVAPGKVIVLKGGGKAELRPPAAATGLPVVTSRGALKLVQMKVINLATTTNVVLASGGSDLEVYGSTIKGDNAEVVVEIASASSGRIFNSFISTTIGEAVGVYSQATADIYARPSVTGHPIYGYTTRLLAAGSSASAITCGQGGNVVLRAQGTGKVIVSNPAGRAVLAETCTLRVINGGAVNAISISGLTGAVYATLSQLILEKPTLQSASDVALRLSQSNARAVSMSFVKSGRGDVALDGASNLKFDSWLGPSLLPAAFDAGYQSLFCEEGSNVFVGDGGVTLPSGTTVDDLRLAYPGCFQ